MTETRGKAGGSGKAVWVAGEKEEEEQHRAQPAAWSGNSLTRQKGWRMQLALPQCTLSIRCQGSHAKAPASHADPGSRSSISEIFSGQIKREANMRHKHQARRELHFRISLSFASLELCGTSWQDSNSDPQIWNAILGVKLDLNLDLC